MIGKSVWRRGILIIGLLTAAAIFYVMSQVQESSQPSAGSLVFSNQFMPQPEPEAEPATTGAGEGRVELADDGKQGDLVAVTALAPTAVPEQSLKAEVLPLTSTAGEAEPVERTPTEPARSAVFDMYRLTREQNRSRQIEIVEGMLQNDRLSETDRRALQEQLFELVRMRELEENAEGLLVARGLSDVIVMLGQKGAEVVVTDLLEREDAARVGDVVARIAGVPLDAITIVDGAPN